VSYLFPSSRPLRHCCVEQLSRPTPATMASHCAYAEMSLCCLTCRLRDMATLLPGCANRSLNWPTITSPSLSRQKLKCAWAKSNRVLLFTRSSKRPANIELDYWSSNRPIFADDFHLLEVCCRPTASPGQMKYGNRLTYSLIHTVVINVYKRFAIHKKCFSVFHFPLSFFINVQQTFYGRYTCKNANLSLK